MLTWEYPPYKVGGIASHCADLSSTLVEKGNDVKVISYGDEKKIEDYQGVEIHRVPSTDNATDTISWSAYLGHEMKKKAIELHKKEKFDVIHAHDWMTIPGASGIKKLLDIPMVFTVHSTQRGRDGINSRYQKAINDLEWYGTYEAKEVISVGKKLQEEVQSIFEVPSDKIRYIPNGVDFERIEELKGDYKRENYAKDWEKLVLFVGRLVRQKGVSHLINSMPSILDKNPDAKFVFAGGGPVEYYKNKAKKLVGDKASFEGFVPEPELKSLFSLADVTVAPSIYEPFGLVPLESAACETPAVGSYVGGMRDTIVHEWTGLHTYPADPNSISYQVSRVLNDLGWSKWMGKNAKKRAKERYDWERIATKTSKAYGDAVED